MDPPRSGLDDTTRNLAKNLKISIYLATQTLHRDLEELKNTQNSKICPI